MLAVKEAQGNVPLVAGSPAATNLRELIQIAHKQIPSLVFICATHHGAVFHQWQVRAFRHFRMRASCHRVTVPITAYDQLNVSLAAGPRKWLVTGVAGFIGSNLLESLLRLNQTVVGLDNFSTGKQTNLDHVRSRVSPAQWARFSFISGTITRPADCLQACTGVDFVLHQAALGSVPKSIDEPMECHESNVTGFINMLQAARETDVKRFVYASSSAVYGDEPGLPKVEQQIGRPLSPYAASKWMDEIYADVFSRTYGFPSAGLRYFNVFGQRQDPNGAYAAVIPKWIDAMLRSEPIYINGDGETSRDFCHVADVVQANLLAAALPDPAISGHVYNIALGQRTTLNQLFQAIRSLVQQHRPGLEIPPPVYRDFRAGDVRHSLADISRARHLLKFEPSLSVEQGLAQALDWYLSQSSTH
jgi:UDP-N-acetylglucosamine 4-epimerase